MKSLPKIIVVCGPTATGKSDYAVALAKRIGVAGGGAEIISADSRQVYRHMDIGSGKITKREMRGIPHHLLDVADPKRVFSVAQFQRKATLAIHDILKRGKTPIICGGTGFYIDAVIYGSTFPDVKPNSVLRKKLAKESIESLGARLRKLDPKRWKTVDQKNKVRLIRAIEIATALGSVPKLKRTAQYDTEWIYLNLPDAVLKQRIHDRLIKRLHHGMLAEIRNLHERHGVSWKRLESFGLEYRYLSLYLQQKLSRTDMLKQLELEIWHFAKRQRTWFKKYAK